MQGQITWINYLDRGRIYFLKLHSHMQTKNYIDMKGFFIILILTILWGLNYSTIKLSNTGLSPVFTSFLRSTLASCCGIAYCIIIKQKLFHRGILLFHGVIVGVLFGLEFVCVYFGLRYTDAARMSILMYLSPFVVAAGAHAFLKEKLNFVKTLGLVLAFLGIYFVFRGKPSTYSEKLMLHGDLLAILGAVLWGATTLYIKKFLAEKVHPINTFLYQLFFSIPIMLICALILEDTWVIHINGYVLSALFFQSVIIAFASYFVWFKLIHAYPVAKLSAFTFLTPIFGVFFGALFYKEQITLWLVLGLVLVCIGIYCANYKKNEKT
jgi:drug/metabolite transporter (DMT)-like permease